MDSRSPDRPGLGERTRLTLVTGGLALLFVALKLAWPYLALDLPGERPLPARWDPDLAVRNGFNDHQVDLGEPVRMVDADCTEMGTATGSVGTCRVRYEDGTSDRLRLTMLEDGGEFDIEVLPGADDVAR